MFSLGGHSRRRKEALGLKNGVLDAWGDRGGSTDDAHFLFALRKQQYRQWRSPYKHLVWFGFDPVSQHPGGFSLRL